MNITKKLQTLKSKLSVNLAALFLIVFITCSPIALAFGVTIYQLLS